MTNDRIGREVEAAFATVREQYEAELFRRLQHLLAGPTHRLEFTLSWQIEGVVQEQGATITKLPKAQVVYRRKKWV